MSAFTSVLATTEVAPALLAVLTAEMEAKTALADAERAISRAGYFEAGEEGSVEVFAAADVARAALPSLTAALREAEARTDAEVTANRLGAINLKTAAQADLDVFQHGTQERAVATRMIGLITDPVRRLFAAESAAQLRRSKAHGRWLDSLDK